jgi:intracellular sulfur oxidation DsrE/DsrF family protein
MRGNIFAVFADANRKGKQMSKQSPSSPERRSFFSRFNAGAASLAALAIGGVAMAQQKSAAPASWEPAHHDKDDWMDSLPGKHRMVIDTTSADGFRNALLFAGNFMQANRDDYGLQNQDLAIIVVARHISTAYGYNNDMWAKYGASLAGQPASADAPAKEPPKANPSAASLVTLSNQGVQFAVCSMATRRLAGVIARAVGGNTDAVNSELIANLVSNGRMVPAGIVAVNRAQERGYSLVSA